MPEIYYEIWQDGIHVSGSDSLELAQHCALVYSKAGPVLVYKVQREVLTYYKGLNDA